MLCDIGKTDLEQYVPTMIRETLNGVKRLDCGK